MTTNDTARKANEAYRKGYDVGYSGEAPSRYEAVYTKKEERNAFRLGVCDGTIARNKEKK